VRRAIFDTLARAQENPMTAAAEKKCAHAACNCTVADGKKYCSETCHDAGKMLELTCQCHHPACEALAPGH
jgi:hypothetical protein